MQRIKIPTNVLNTSVTYLTGDGVVQTSVVKNPYTSTGCAGEQYCGDYSAVAKCLIDIYQGIRTCQTIYILDKDGTPLDLDGVEWIDITIANEYGCNVYWFSTREREFYNPIVILQKKIDGTLLKANASNWNSFVTKHVFDKTNIAIENNAIVFGGSGVGEVVLNPVEYNEKLVLRITPTETNKGKMFARFNGSPNPIKFNSDNELISMTSDGGVGVVDLVGADSNNTPNVVSVSEIELKTVAVVQEKGGVKICFDEKETIDVMPAAINAVVTFKFKKGVADGGIHVISCVKVGRFVKNTDLDDSLETPILSHEVIPELVPYDNKKSGLQSTNVKDAMEEACLLINTTTEDKNYTCGYVCPGNVEYAHTPNIYVCRYDEERMLWYWDVWHKLGVMEVNVSMEDFDGNDVEGEIEYIDKNNLKVWFTECVEGYVYIN